MITAHLFTKTFCIRSHIVCSSVRKTVYAGYNKHIVTNKQLH